MKVLALNRRVSHDYEILTKFTAGLVLTSAEVKSLRSGNASLAEAYGIVNSGEVFLLNSYIAIYDHARTASHDARRTRKLLLTKKEIKKIIGDVSVRGLTIIPLKIWSPARGFLKVDIALCKHKKTFDRKQEIKERDLAREARREIKDRF